MNAIFKFVLTKFKFELQLSAIFEEHHFQICSNFNVRHFELPPFLIFSNPWPPFSNMATSALTLIFSIWLPARYF